MSSISHFSGYIYWVYSELIGGTLKHAVVYNAQKDISFASQVLKTRRSLWFPTWDSSVLLTTYFSCLQIQNLNLSYYFRFIRPTCYSCQNRKYVIIQNDMFLIVFGDQLTLSIDLYGLVEHPYIPSLLLANYLKQISKFNQLWQKLTY